MANAYNTNFSEKTSSQNLLCFVGLGTVGKWFLVRDGFSCKKRFYEENSIWSCMKILIVLGENTEITVCKLVKLSFFNLNIFQNINKLQTWLNIIVVICLHLKQSEHIYF